MDCFAALAMTGEGMAQRLMEVFPPEIQPVAAGPSRAVIARSEATKQSILSFAEGHGLLRCARNDGRGYGPATHGGLPTGDSARRCRTKSRRHCEERSDEASHSIWPWRDGLLRCASNDGEGMAQRLMEVFPPEIQPVAAGPSRAVIARSEATKQSILSCRGEMDCFA